MSHSPNKPSVRALVPPPKVSVTKFDILSFPWYRLLLCSLGNALDYVGLEDMSKDAKKGPKKNTVWLFLLCTAGNLAVAIMVEHVDNPDHGFLMHTNRLITFGETNKTNSAWVPRWWNALARDTGQSSHQAAVKISLLSYTPKFYITAQEWRLIIWHAILAIASLVAVVHIETCICIEYNFSSSSILRTMTTGLVVTPPSWNHVGPTQ